MQTDVEYANGRQANAIVGDLCCECRNLRNQTRKECYALRTEELIKQSRPEISRDPSALCGAISSSAGAASSPAIEISRRSEWDVLFFLCPPTQPFTWRDGKSAKTQTVKRQAMSMASHESDSASWWCESRYSSDSSSASFGLLKTRNPPQMTIAVWNETNQKPQNEKAPFKRPPARHKTLNARWTSATSSRVLRRTKKKPVGNQQISSVSY